MPYAIQLVAGTFADASQAAEIEPYDAVRMLPRPADNRTKAQQIAQRPNNLVMAVLIAAIWLAAAWWLGRFIYNRLK